MSNGRNPTDNDADVEFIASTAAALVAAGDYSRTDAIKVVIKYLKDSREADGDVTGTKEVELEFPQPSKKSQLIKSERSSAN